MGEGKARRISIFFITVILVMLVMSLVALMLAVETYVTQGNIDVMNTILSVSTIALSIYLLFQMRKRTLSLDFEALKVLTVIQCTKCNYRNVKDFEKGDYILKEVGSCPKCDGTLLIYSIFREVKEKEKSAGI